MPLYPYRRRKSYLSRRRRRPFGRYRRNYSLRNYSGRGNRFGYVQTVVDRAPITSDRQFAVLPFCGEVHMTASGVSLFHFTANDIFEPFPSGFSGNRQPRGFKEYETLYSQYIVHACTIRVSMVSGVAPPSFYCVIPSAENIITITDPSRAIEHPYGQGKVMPGDDQLVSMLECKMPSKKIFGKAVLNRDNDGSPFTGSPINKWYWNVAFQSAGVTNNGYCQYALYYYCEFFDRKELNVSNKSVEDTLYAEV